MGVAEFVRIPGLAPPEFSRIPLHPFAKRASRARCRLAAKRSVGRHAMKHQRVWLLGLTVLLGGTPGGGAQEKPAPQKPGAVPPGVTAHRDLEYVKDGHERHKLDLYLPEKADGPLPVIVWVHGGGWRQGDKRGGPALPFAARGFAVASINYRLSPHAPFPAQIEDC